MGPPPARPKPRKCALNPRGSYAVLPSAPPSLLFLACRTDTAHRRLERAKPRKCALNPCGSYAVLVSAPPSLLFLTCRIDTARRRAAQERVIAVVRRALRYID